MLFLPSTRCSGSATIPQQASTTSFRELVLELNRRQHRRPRRKYRSRHRQYENGVCRAVRRAFSAALMRRQTPGLSLRQAAELTGSNTAYAAAADVVLASENRVLLDAALSGKLSLLAAAMQANPAAKLVTAYRRADHEAKLAFATAISPEKIWDEVVTPALGIRPVPTTPSVEDIFEALRHEA